VSILPRKRAEELAKKMREISVAEFFEKNKQILGFDSLQKSMVIAVKEAVDNSLDACEEAGILPDILVEIKKEKGRDEYKIVVEDNGPGIVRKKVPLVFGKLLYGSRFHAMKQSRGQQGIGISAVVLYAQLTTGNPAVIITKTESDYTAYKTILRIDTRKNEPIVISQEPHIWNKPHGTRVEVIIKGRYARGKQSVYEYLQNTAIVNPHARITLIEPDGKKTIFERAVEILPQVPKEIKPHPHGIELGDLMRLAKESSAKTVENFLARDFSRISPRKAKEICKSAGIDCSKKPSDLTLKEGKKLLEVFQKTKFMPPPTDCLSPIGEKLIKKGLKNVLGNLRPSFYAQPVTREPKVYGGNPFIVEAGLVYGGDLPSDSQVKILRYANRIPLLYQQGSCAITKAVESIDWRRYGLEQRGGKGIPVGPAIILVHIASTRIPYTSEAKEAIAEIPEIVSEIRNALQKCGRDLRMHIAKNRRKSKVSEKFQIVQKILPEIARKSAEILDRPVPSLERVIAKVMNVVWIDESFEKKGNEIRIKTKIVNYTDRKREFKLYADVPLGKIINANPPGEIREDDVVVWDVSVQPYETENYEIILTNASNYSETTYYVEGINPVMVIGAEPLPGDWDIKTLEIIEEESEEEEEKEEEEIYEEEEV